MNDLRSAVRVLSSHKWFSAAVIDSKSAGRANVRATPRRLR